MLDIESYHERTSETISRELWVPVDAPEGEHPNLNLSVYVYYECMCVCILHIYSSYFKNAPFSIINDNYFKEQNLNRL